MASQRVDLEITRLIAILAQVNACKDADEIMPVSCFKQIDRMLTIKKNQRFVLLKERETLKKLADSQFTPPNLFWPSNPDRREGFNMFSRLACIGCSDMENKAAALALAKIATSHRLVFDGKPITSWGLCRTTVEPENVLTIVYKWSFDQKPSLWDKETQSDKHNHLYFDLTIENQNCRYYFDLSALQYGIYEAPEVKDGAMPIPYVFLHEDECKQFYGQVYKNSVLLKTNVDLANEVLEIFGDASFMKNLISQTEDFEQQRKLVQLTRNYQKFTVALFEAVGRTIVQKPSK